MKFHRSIPGVVDTPVLGFKQATVAVGPLNETIIRRNRGVHAEAVRIVGTFEQTLIEAHRVADFSPRDAGPKELRPVLEKWDSPIVGHRLEAKRDPDVLGKCLLGIGAVLAFGTRADRPAKPKAALPTIRYSLAEVEETFWDAH